MMSAFLVMAANVLAGFEFVMCAAVRALGFTGAGHIQVHLGMAIPEFHIGLSAGAVHAAIAIDVFGQEFNCVAHVRFLKVQTSLLRLW
jgi:hypothetical protein